MTRQGRLLLPYLLTLFALAFACQVRGQETLYFTAPWCGPCVQQKPATDRVAAEGLIRVVDFDAERELAARYGVSGPPAFVKLDAQGNVLETLAGGPRSEAEILAFAAQSQRPTTIVSQPGEPRWWNFQPAGAIDGQGILRDVVSRVVPAELASLRSQLAAQSANDPSTLCHEGTHFVNAFISRQAKQSYGGLYVGNGRCLLLKEPRVTVGNVAALIPTEQRASTFRTYLSGDRVTRNALSVMDEFVCYANDAQCTKELNVPDDGGLERAGHFARYADALIEAIRRHDPGYSDLPQLTAFVAWQKQRVQQLGGQR